jgi:UDP-N-acetylmuramoyl-tripeptide--D-alanyl-D-alanine ligase
VSPKDANKAVADYTPGNMRSQVVSKGSKTVILDAYNANPSSMQAAIENLAAMKALKKVLILGDMFELEGESEKEHRNLGKLIATKNFTDVYFCGKLIRVAKEEYPAANYFENKEDLIKAIKNKPMEDATVLIKASRGIGLETVLEHL